MEKQKMKMEETIENLELAERSKWDEQQNELTEQVNKVLNNNLKLVSLQFRCSHAINILLNMQIGFRDEVTISDYFNIVEQIDEVMENLELAKRRVRRIAREELLSRP